MKYAFHPEALAEYAEAIRYYAEQRAEVAQAFIDAVEDAIYQIRESPTRWGVIDEDVRRCLTRKFPYGILYTIEQDFGVSSQLLGGEQSESYLWFAIRRVVLVFC